MIIHKRKGGMTQCGMSASEQNVHRVWGYVTCKACQRLNPTAKPPRWDAKEAISREPAKSIRCLNSHEFDLAKFRRKFKEKYR